MNDELKGKPLCFGWYPAENRCKECHFTNECFDERFGTHCAKQLSIPDAETPKETVQHDGIKHEKEKTTG